MFEQAKRISEVLTGDSSKARAKVASGSVYARTQQSNNNVEGAIHKYNDGNHDACGFRVLRDGSTVIVVADGIAGGQLATAAAKLAVKTILDKLTDSDGVLNDTTMEKVFEGYQNDWPRRLWCPGACIAACVISPDGKKVTYVTNGDARVTIVNARKGKFVVKSKDGAVGQGIEDYYLKCGDSLKDAEKKRMDDPRNNQVLTCLSTKEDSKGWTIVERKLNKHDVVVASSDGLTGVSTSEQIATAAGEAKGGGSFIYNLLEAINREITNNLKDDGNPTKGVDNLALGVYWPSNARQEKSSNQVSLSKASIMRPILRGLGLIVLTVAIGSYFGNALRGGKRHNKPIAARKNNNNKPLIQDKFPDVKRNEKRQLECNEKLPLHKPLGFRQGIYGINSKTEEGTTFIFMYKNNELTSVSSTFQAGEHLATYKVKEINPNGDVTCELTYASRKIRGVRINSQVKFKLNDVSFPE